MPVLKNPKHEQFALAYARTGKGGESYTSVYGPSKGADQSAGRLLRNAQIVERVRAVLAEVSAGTIQLEISHRDARVAAQQDRWMRMRSVITARSADPTMQAAPGGSTGLLVRRQKAIGNGKRSQVVDEYEVDGVLLRELREVEKHAAMELGQWQEPGITDPGGAGGTALATTGIELVQLMGLFYRNEIEAQERAAAKSK